MDAVMTTSTDFKVIAPLMPWGVRRTPATAPDRTLLREMLNGTEFRELQRQLPPGHCGVHRESVSAIRSAVVEFL